MVLYLAEGWVGELLLLVLYCGLCQTNLFRPEFSDLFLRETK